MSLDIEIGQDSRKDLTGTQCIRRTFAIVRLLAGGSQEGEKLVDIANLLHLSHPTTHRILKALVDEGVVERAEGSQRYRLGAETAWLGVSAFQRFPMPRIAARSLDELAKNVGDTVLLTVASQNDAVCVDRRFGNWPIQARRIMPGARRPLGVTLGGCAILAHIGEERMEAILRENAERYKSWHCEIATVRASIQETREKGYTVNDSLLGRDHRVLAVPVRDVVGRSVAALSIVAPKARLGADRLSRIVPQLRQSAKEVAEALQKQRASK